MEIVVTDRALEDLARLPGSVSDTYIGKKEDVQKNLDLGVSPGKAFDKFLSGNMHPVLQLDLGRDYRAWFVQGKYVDDLENEKVFGWRVLTKKEAEKLADKIRDPLSVFESGL